MLRTGHSCENLRKKARHGCKSSTEYYCIATGKTQIDPFKCYIGCKWFGKIADNYRKKEKIPVELL